MVGLNPVGLSGRSHSSWVALYPPDKLPSSRKNQLRYPVGKVIHLLCWGQFFPKRKLLLRLLACPHMQVLRGSSGVITSPGYPHSYPNNQRCSWKITGSSGDRVKLVIHGASLERCCDYIQIQNGYLQSSGSNPGLMYGSFGTRTFISSRETLIVHFYSDISITRGGFRAIYTILRNGK